ncbi:MAG: hypothetical protein IJM25_08700 [Eubacterium sp.]|nr:hypothetical protein [Eubacterium sp.]
MELGKAFQNFTGSLTGNNTKAVLCIRKVERNIDQNNNEGLDALGALEAGVTQKYDQLNQQLLRKAEASLKGKKVATYDDIREFALDKNYIALEVQYNPSSLRLDTAAGKQMDFAGDNARRDLSLYNAPAATILSMELLFDDTNNMDAFMLGDNPLTGFTPSNAANTVTSVMKGVKNGYSVQRQMQGLLSLLTIKEAQRVIFFWGSMSFHGILTDVEEQYTMFNKRGQPIRGRVSLSIRQDDYLERDEHHDANYTYDKEYWSKAFDDTFQEPGTGSGVLGTVNKFTNNSLMNLKL